MSTSAASSPSLCEAHAWRRDAFNAANAGDHYGAWDGYTVAAAFFAQLGERKAAAHCRREARMAMELHTAGMPVLRNAVIAEIGA
jgi:hypothetical protein